jgi:hypothetical protein
VAQNGFDGFGNTWVYVPLREAVLPGGFEPMEGDLVKFDAKRRNEDPN